MNGRIPSKVKVILNGVDTQKFYPGSALPELLDRYKLNGNKIVGLITNLSKRKMPEYLLEACPYILKDFPHVQFIIVGGDFGEEDKDRKSKLIQKAKLLGISDHVVFTGFLSDVSNIIKTFDIGASVTEKEACSRAIIEIMSSGKPIVAFDTGGNPELVENGVTGILIKFKDIKKYAESIVELLEDDKKRMKMGMLARERVEKYFDIKISTQKTQDLYLKLVGTKNI
jgi:glycosyltransferase involved in cell wall biosynthesis